MKDYSRFKITIKVNLSQHKHNYKTSPSMSHMEFKMYLIFSSVPSPQSLKTLHASSHLLSNLF